MNLLQEILIVSGQETRRTVRSAKSIVFLVFYSLAAIAGGLVFFKATSVLQAALSAAPEHADALTQGALAIVFSQDSETVHYLSQIPLVVVFMVWFSFLFLPLLATLIGFDQIAGELQSGALRFTALRARRISILVGKAAAQLLILLGLTAIINLAIFVYASVFLNFPIAVGLVAMVRFWLLTIVYTSAYVGLVSLCSTVFRMPILSLLTSLSILFAFWILRLLNLPVISYFIPSNYQENLFSPDISKVMVSVAVYCGFAAIFIGLSGLVISRRNL